MEKKSIFDNFRRGSGNKSKDEPKDKKHFSDEMNRERKSVPIEEHIPDPIRHVNPPPQSRERAWNDSVSRVRGLSDNLHQRSSPLGPRNLPRDNTGERAPYEPKYFTHSSSMSSLNGSSPTKQPSSSIQSARSMSQTSQRDGTAMKSAFDNGRPAPVTRSSEYPQRSDSKVPQLRRGQSNRDDETVFDLRLSQAYDIRQVVRHAPAVPQKVDVRASTHGVIDEATPTFGAYPMTPRRPKQRSKLNQETSMDNGDDYTSKENHYNELSRWGTYSAQDSPNAVASTPSRSVSNGEEMQQWLKQNSQAFGKVVSSRNSSPQSNYEASPSLKDELEKFELYKKSSHQRKLSLEGTRKAQEAMKVHSRNPQKRDISGNKRSPARITKHNSHGSVRKASARTGSYHQDNYGSRVVQKRLPEVKYPPGEMPSPFLRPEEKGQMVAQKTSIGRKALQGKSSALSYPGSEHTLKPIQESESEESPEPISKHGGRSRLPTPSKAIRRKTLKGPTASDLAKKRALEYQKLAQHSPFEDQYVKVTPKLGLPRSFPELNMAIRSISTPTYVEVDSEPFEFPELVPRPLNLKKRSSRETIRAVLGRKPTLRTSKTQGPPAAMGKRGYWNFNNRTKSDDVETLKERQKEQDSVKDMHDQIDDYLDILLQNKIESRLAEEAVQRLSERSFSRTTVERESHYYGAESDSEDDRLHRASMAAEKSRWEELSAEEAQSGSSPAAKERNTVLIKDIKEGVTDEEVTPTKPETVVVEAKDRWAEMRAKLRVESTYSDLSILARSPNI